MSLIKKIKDKKVNFEFNKEYIKVVTSKIANNDAQFITNSFNEMHPADAADIIDHCLSLIIFLQVVLLHLHILLVLLTF